MQFIAKCVIGLALIAAVACAPMKLVMLNNAVADGAVCLDGTAPGYYIRYGAGQHATDFIVYLEGGGWCTSASDCASRATTALGSSKQWPASLTLDGFLSDDLTVNPAFASFTMVFVPCAFFFIPSLSKFIVFMNRLRWRLIQWRCR